MRDYTSAPICYSDGIPCDLVGCDLASCCQFGIGDTTSNSRCHKNPIPRRSLKCDMYMSGKILSGVQDSQLDLESSHEKEVLVPAGFQTITSSWRGWKVLHCLVGAHPGTIEDSGFSVCTSATGLGVSLCGLSVDVKLSNCS